MRTASGNKRRAALLMLHYDFPVVAGQVKWQDTNRKASHRQVYVPSRHPCRQLQFHCSPPRKASVQQHSASAFNDEQWEQGASQLLKRLGLPATTTPRQLLQHLSSKHEQQQESHQQQLLQVQKALDLQSCRVLMNAAAAACNNQQYLNQLHTFVKASAALFPEFELQDFQQLLQLCAQARYIPDKEWLAAIIYADTGGFERFYKQEPPQDVVSLFSALSAMLGSHRQLMVDTQLHVQQQQQQQASGGEAADLAAEVAALQQAVHLSVANLKEVYQDSLLAGELSAVGGYWLLRILLPQLRHDTAAVLKGLTALPGLNYQVLDSEDADLLLQHIADQLPYLTCTQLATAITSCLPCLGDTAPTLSDKLAELFQFAGAAAIADDGFSGAQAAQVLVVLAELPGYAPDPQVAQSLLDRSLQPPLAFNASQLYQLLTAASELQAIPRPEHMGQLQQVLGKEQ